MAVNPLSQGNWLQRRYHAWAAPHYARMAPSVREQAELIDCFLYSRRGLGVWLGMACALVGATWGMSAAGLPFLLSISISLVVFAALPMGALGAWLQPERFVGRRLRKSAPAVVALGFAGALVGFIAGHVGKHGSLDLPQLLRSLGSAMALIAPIVLLAMLGMVALLWGVAQTRRQILERELERATVAAERDAAARQVSEAQLKLLQGQIQPHFIFNTLSALQHWVDTQDRRSGPLLQSLTSFLRGSTELLGRGEISLGEEAAMVGHYLAILQARLGPRLRCTIEIAPELVSQVLPAGLLLTLVENAVEHGIAPSLAGGELRITAARQDAGWNVCVRDDGPGLAPGWHEGVGLANCRQRLRHHFGARATLQLSDLRPGTLACLAVHDGPP
jgi:signal transduction histidine kinase